MPNLGVFMMTLLQVGCFTVHILCRLSLSVDEYAVVEKPLADVDFGYHWILKIHLRVSLQMVFFSLGPSLSCKGFCGF